MFYGFEVFGGICGFVIGLWIDFVVGFNVDEGILDGGVFFEEVVVVGCEDWIFICWELFVLFELY